MKWIKNNIAITLALFIGASFAIGAGVQQQWPTDLIKFGVGTSTDNKIMEIDVGDGATNPKIIVDFTNKDFEFTKAVKIAGDLLRLGDGTNTNKVIEFDVGLGVANPRFRWNSVDLTLEFANDGVNFVAIGTGGGGGGGTNFLGAFNPGFEQADPPKDWTNTGAGTFVAETTTIRIDGKQSGKWDPSAAAETLDSQLVVINDGFGGAVGQLCLVEILYKWPTGTSGQIELKVQDQVPNTILTVPLTPTTGDNSRFAQLNFDCPALADSLKIRFESTADAAEITIDSVFLGYGKNSSNINNSSFFGSVKITGCSVSRVNTGWADMKSTSGPCVYATEGNALAPVAGTEFGLQFASMPKGRYLFHARGIIASNGSAVNNAIDLRFSDDTNTFGEQEFSSGDVNGERLGIPGFNGAFSYGSNQSNVNIEIQAATFLAGSAITIRSNSTGLEGGQVLDGFKIDVYYFPSDSSQSITLKTVGEHWDVNIGGSNPSLPITTTAEKESTDTLLDMVIAPGSQTAQIPCINGTAPEGLTCNSSSVSESIGIAFIPSTAGRFKVCMSFIHQPVSSGGDIGTAFQLMETGETDAITVLQTGRDIASQRETISQTTGGKVDLCSAFTFSSIGKKVIRLFHEVSAGGSIASNNIISDRAASQMGRDIHITVDQLDVQTPTPILTNLQSDFAKKIDGNANNLRTVTANINNPAGTFTITQQDGTWIDSITDVGVGQSTLNVSPGIFSGAPNCNCTSLSVNRFCAFTTNHTNVGIFVRTIGDTGNFQESSYYIECTGPK